MRYLFNIADGDASIPDQDGTELEDDEAARVEARRVAGLALSDAAKRGRCRRTWRLDVTDYAGRPVFTLPFADALQPEHLRA